MIIDEIYSAALQGNYTLLESLLSRRQTNLNQLYDAGTSGGMRTRVPFLFYVLRAISSGRIDPRTLSLLVSYGADINGCVIIESAGATAVLPFLAYSMMEWNSPEMTACLLQNGADPNGAREVAYPGGGQSVMPMLCLALQNPDAVFTEILLRSGADPNEYADVYYPSAGYAQQLPALYYALVEQRSEEKLHLLAAHGASAHFPISLSDRPEDRIPFKRYIQAAYPGLVSALSAAFPGAASAQPPMQSASQAWDPSDRAKAHMQPDEPEDLDVPDAETEEEDTDKKKKTPLNLNGLAAFLKTRLPEKKAPAKKAEKKREKTTAAPAAPVSNRRCYGKFIAYLFGNFAVLTLAFMVIAPLCFIGTDREMALIGFVVGLPCLAVCALIWWRVSSKAKRYGQVGVMPQFVLDSLLMFVKVLLMMLVVTIPLVKAIGDNTPWEERTTSTGRNVFVKKTGDDEYEDAMGNRYSSH